MIYAGESHTHHGAGRGRVKLHLLHGALFVHVEEELEAGGSPEGAQAAPGGAPQCHGHVA